MNSPRLSRAIPVLALALLLGACSVPKPSEDAFRTAENAIAQAEAHGADEYAPVEMRFAREKLAEARRGMETREFDKSNYLIEQSEINVELAIALTRAARVREAVSETRKTVGELQRDFDATYGDSQ